MKIDRDNFRHLTGFGRDMANYAGKVIDEVFDGKAISSGNIQIGHNYNENTLRYMFTPFEVSLEPQSEYTLPGDFMLSIVTKRGDFCEVTSIPLWTLNPLGSCQYHIYQHIFFSDQNDEPIQNATYTGVTKRGWRTRWTEHLRAAQSGSHCLFHGAIRQWHGIAKIVMHQIVGTASSEHVAMKMEEELVERDSYYPNGLNMIPGGYAGIAHLRNLGVLGKRERVGVDSIDAIINRFCNRPSRDGVPNPKAALNWLLPGYAEKVICGGSDRLKPQQIRAARSFASLGQNVDDIALRIGARNAAQVQRLVSGQTYSRIL